MSSDAELVRLAHDARTRAIAPISKYRVGAAIRAVSGTGYTGCNIEHVVLGETVCAEKVALFKALEAGERDFEDCAVSTSSSPPATPCGSCRQHLISWGIKRVISANDDHETLEWSMDELLPGAFTLDL